MKKRFLSLICALLCLIVCFASACDGGSSASESSSSSALDSSSSTVDPLPEKEVVHCLKDVGLHNGFLLLGMHPVNDTAVKKTVKFGDEEPAWSICQWWSKHNLAGGEESDDGKQYSLKNQGKTLGIDREKVGVTLEVSGSNEFESYNEQAPAEWPHLLVHGVTKPIALSDAEKIDASLNFTLTKSEDKRNSDGNGFQAQFAWFIYISDVNPESAGYNNFLYFGLNIFDSTKVYAPASAQQDTANGPGSFIYALGANQFMQKRVKTNVNNSFTYDILPEIKNSISVAQSKGFMQGSSFEDLAIIGMNIGWEVFDRWDVSVTIYDMAIDKTVKE